jgi:CHAT domain-containing protein
MAQEGTDAYRVVVEEFTAALNSLQFDEANYILTTLENSEVARKELKASKGKRRLRALTSYWRCALTGTIALHRSDKDSFANSINESLLESKWCAADFLPEYRDDVFFQTLNVLPHIYGWIFSLHFSLDQYDSCLVYLDFQEEALTSSLYPQSESFANLQASRGLIYKYLGDDIKAATFYRKATDYFDNFYPKCKYDVLNKTDTMEYFRVVLGYLDLIKDDKQYYDLLKRAQKIAVCDGLYRPFSIQFGFSEFDFFYRQKGNLRLMEECLHRIQELIDGLINSESENHYHLQILDAWRDYYYRALNWDKVIELNDSLKNSSVGPSDLIYMQSYWQKSDTINSRKYADALIDTLKSEYQLLPKLNQFERENFVRQRQSASYSILASYFSETLDHKDNADAFFKLSYLFKNLSVKVLSKGYESFDTSTITAIKKVSDALNTNELFVDIISVIRFKPDSNFRFVAMGFKYNQVDSLNKYPIVTDIIDKSPAFYSTLQIGDTIFSINRINLDKLSASEIQQLIQQFSIKQPITLVVKSAKRNIDNRVVTLSKDSIWGGRIDFKRRNVAFGISKNKGLHYSVSPEYNYTGNEISLLYEKYIKDGSYSKELNELTQFLSFFFNTEKRIFISTDGIFNKINLETLYPLDSSKETKYLGDRLSIVQVNNASDISKTETASKIDNSIVLFGYPNYTLSRSEKLRLIESINVDANSLSFLRGGEPNTGSYIFKPLPATKHEVEEIGATLQQKGWNVQIYTGNKALEEQVKSTKNPRILHIATHGFFASDLKPETQQRFMGKDSKEAMENPMLRSGLAFVGAETTRTDTSRAPITRMDDGILTAEEAQYLQLDSTELVVLSACETGLGEIVNGEGVYGLQRAFRAAGAKSVLMSLWKVDDLATETLMKNFYKHWLDDGMSKHDALWQAKLDLRNDKAHPEWAKPYYWGAFVLIGQ